MAFATTFRHSPTEPVRGRELDVNFDALGVYVDGTFLPLTGGTITGNLTVTGNTTLTGTLAINGTWDGWIGSGETWTYASATTFTISGDLTAKYRKGDKIKLTQTTVKYFYITIASHSAGTTTITVTGGSDYSLANAAITLPFYSKMDTPTGFPDWFNYTLSWTADSSNPAIGNGTIESRFTIDRLTVTAQINIQMGNTTTFGADSWRFSFPLAPDNLNSANVDVVGVANLVDSGTGFRTGTMKLGNSAVFMYCAYGDGSAQVTQNAPWVWATNDSFTAQITYKF